MRALVLLWLPLALTCKAPIPPYSGPPALGMDGRDTYAHYLSAQPTGIKMRHQVETRFGPHDEVIEGFVILARPHRFWVRALSPLGATLFDVRALAPGEMRADIRLDEIQEAAAPLFLARDIRRMYLRDCPADATIEPSKIVDGGFVVSCDLPVDEETIVVQSGPDPPDDRLLTHVSPGGVVVRKCFYRTGEVTACIDYLAYIKTGGLWLARQLRLHHHQVDYDLKVVLLEADPAYDAAAAFLRAGAESSP